MKNLTISVDTGAKNNGTYIAFHDKATVSDKKALNIIVDEKKINFSKVSRRSKRHQIRGNKREKLAKRLLCELIDCSRYDQKQLELIKGLLKNRGYTYLSADTKFETLLPITVKFLDTYLPTLGDKQTKSDFEAFLDEYSDDENKVKVFLNESIKNIEIKLHEIDIALKKKNVLKDIDNIFSAKYDEKFKAFSQTKSLFAKHNVYFPKTIKSNDTIKSLVNNALDLSGVNRQEVIDYIESLDFDEEFLVFYDDIKENLKALKGYFQTLIKEIETGAKSRQKYLKEIKEEIDSFDFIEDKERFFQLVGNISNFQLRMLRKFFNNNSSHKSRMMMVRRYFRMFHYKSEKEKQRIEKLLPYLNRYDDFQVFLEQTPPELTIPPFEDMNNRHPYKCNSMFIKPDLITDELKETIEMLLNTKTFEMLKVDENGEFAIKPFIKHRPISGNKTERVDYTYAIYLQRILDATEDVTTKELNPRNVFKHKKRFEKGSIDSIEMFKKEFGEEVYRTLKPIAERYYAEEAKIQNGIWIEEDSILTKCQTNTPYKNNVKHLLLKPVYDAEFSVDDVAKLLEAIKSQRGLMTAMKKIADERSKYGNAFYQIVQSCLEDKKCVDDKDIKDIVKHLPKTFEMLKEALRQVGIEDTHLEKVDTFEENIKRSLSTLIQTYDILFNDLGGFHKTCKMCTVENGIRSKEGSVIAKRLLSDVGKPIDGMLDMMLDRIAWEIVEELPQDWVEQADDIKIVLEQNKFQFEQSLNQIKQKNNKSIKKIDVNEKHKDLLNVNICAYTGNEFNIDEGEWDHILPRSKGLYNSKANLILVSATGNQNKGNTNYILKNLKLEHLKMIFGTDDLQKIKGMIEAGVESIDESNFTNYENLTLSQQKAMRYALFMKGSKAYDKAFRLVQMDKIKNRSNGTQKRLARLISQKLYERFGDTMRGKTINSRVYDAALVSAMRSYLAESDTSLKKEKIQPSHSHAVDAMVLFYLDNCKLKGRKDKQTEEVNKFEPEIDFKDIYLASSGIKNVQKRKKYINSDKKEIGAFKLFDETIYAEHYQLIEPNKLDNIDIDKLIEYGLLYKNQKGKKVYISSKKDLDENNVYKIDIQKTSDLILTLFEKKDKESLESLRFLDELRFFTSRKEIKDIFFKNGKQLLSFDKIKNIPPGSKKLYKAVYRYLDKHKNSFLVNDTLHEERLNELLKELFASKQLNPQSRKRERKRHKYLLPILGAPNFRIKRGRHWQVLGNADIATRNYIINGEVEDIPFFSKNTLPVKIEDLLKCLKLSPLMKPLYDVNINTSEIEDFVQELKYIVVEKSRCIVEVSLKKSSFQMIGFDAIRELNGSKDCHFRKLIHIIDNRESLCNSCTTPTGNYKTSLLNPEDRERLKKYLGSIRDGLKGKATLIENSPKSFKIQYRARIDQSKKDLIIKATTDETYHSQ